MNRKEFLNASLAMSVGLACAPLSSSQKSSSSEGSLMPSGRELPRRKLGRTGEKVTMLGLGGYHLGTTASEREACKLVEVALEQGLRFFDNAESYQSGKAERWMGTALKDVRDDVFLMTKTHSPEDRSRESAKRHLEGSLKRLKTDRLDLWQLHSIKGPEDVDRAFAEGGAMEYILEMKDQGVVGLVGVTGHMRPEAHERAIAGTRACASTACNSPSTPWTFTSAVFRPRSCLGWSSAVSA